MAAAMNENNFSQTSPASVLRGSKIPYGHILCNDKWRGSKLVSTLQGAINVLYEDQLGVVDFHPSSNTAVLYITEGDLVMGQSYRRRVVKLRKVESMQGIVLVEKTPATNQYFGDLQKFVAITLGMVVIPVTCQQEAGNLLIQMVQIENRPSLNPLLSKRRQCTKDQSVLLTVQTIPKLGEVKAKVLLEKFKSIKDIANATAEELVAVVGKASAQHIHRYFNEPP